MKLFCLISRSPVLFRLFSPFVGPLTLGSSGFQSTCFAGFWLWVTATFTVPFLQAPSRGFFRLCFDRCFSFSLLICLSIWLSEPFFSSSWAASPKSLLFSLKVSTCSCRNLRFVESIVGVWIFSSEASICQFRFFGCDGCSVYSSRFTSSSSRFQSSVVSPLWLLREEGAPRLDACFIDCRAIVHVVDDKSSFPPQRFFSSGFTVQRVL